MLVRKAKQTGAPKSGSPGQLSRRICAIVRRLEKTYGLRQWQPCDQPVEELVSTILSQNTSDSNSSFAYEQTHSLFPHVGQRD